MRPIWKGWIGEPKLKNDQPATQAREIRSLKETSTNLGLAEIILGVGEVAGFALTGSSLTDHGLRLSRVEAMLYIFNASYPITVLCPTCQHVFNDILGDFCGNCGTKTIWVSIPPAKPGDRACPYCFHPATQDQNFCTSCGKALPALSSNGSSVRLAPFRPWSLP